jgi:DNA polymerase I
MRKRFVYDIESDGFVRRMTRVHCLVLWDLDTQELLSFRNDGNPENADRLAEGVRMLHEADFRAGHNIIKFDEPALAKIYPFFVPNREGVVFDTLIATRLIWPNIADSDKGRVQRETLKGRNIGSHSLDSWGQRLGCWKGDYSDKKKEEIKAAWEAAGNDTPLDEDELNRLVWEKWTPEMQSYCDQDVIVNTKLFAHCNKKGYAKRALDDEMAMAILCQKIEANGFPFKEKAAETLYVTLGMERAVIDAKLRDFFGLWVEPAGAVKTPSVSNAAQGYWGEAYWEYLDKSDGLDRVAPEDLTASGMPTAFTKRLGVKRVFKGYPYTPIKIIEFAPTNRFHIANRLKALYGWEPSEYTPGGEPKVDDEILQGLPFEAAPLLCEYFVVNKRISALAEGKQAWLKLVHEGRIHGSYNTVGAVTRRATHSRPNIGQVPGATHAKDGSAVYGKAAGWGTECRELFGVPEGWVQVGTDASGLELRCLGHFMGRWDGGAYSTLVTTGDVHTANQIAAGLPTRDNAKTFIYAFLYGAGDEKIGSIVGGTSARGKLLKSTFLSGLPALGSLVKAVKTKAKEHKHLTALDGGRLHVRSDHSALNTLLQSAGALICKKWGVLLEKELLRRGYKHGWDGDFVFMAWVHDEYQIAARSKELANEIGEISKWAIRETEKYFDFRCPLDADFKIGNNWAECH